MNIRLALVLCPVVLAACASSDPYEKRAYEERVRQERYVARAIDKAPKWMFSVPTSNAAIYESGTAISGDFSMADIKAKADAFGKICMLIGGTASQRTKIYRRDTEAVSTEQTEMALRTSCKEVDLTGVEVQDIRRIQEGTRFRTYVLIAMPIGDANILMKAKEAQAERSISTQRSVEAFKELDKQ